MTETKTETKKAPNQVFKLTLVLFLVAAIVSGVLGLVNYVTKDRIAEITAQKTASAFSEVLAADSYEEIAYTGESGDITGLYKAGDAGYVVQLNVSGSQGMINLVVGVDTSGTVTGVSIIKSSETASLGAKASEPEFRDQFIDAAEHVAVSKDGGTIQAISGATITSRAVSNAVNTALDAVAELG